MGMPLNQDRDKIIIVVLRKQDSCKILALAVKSLHGLCFYSIE